MIKLPEEINKKYENRKTHEQEFTVEKIDRLERQKQVYSYRLQGYKNLCSYIVIKAFKINLN